MRIANEHGQASGSEREKELMKLRNNNEKTELLGWDGGSRRHLGRVGHAAPMSGRATAALRVRGGKASKMHNARSLRKKKTKRTQGREQREYDRDVGRN